RGEVNGILKYGEKVNEVDTEEMEGRSEVVEVRNVMGDDERKERVWIEEVMGNGGEVIRVGGDSQGL
ncbi:Asp-tRNA(Asn)/Glu-tRNA(Gln) amidotransferase subunit GatC, partial [Paenibacillus xylanexedens]|uniref:Asp-tRNA(Asn)/Glu-tRNA(Gln) amidotransferase subunit GatC n=1 Tax=Paenibacillus xylanexedens TaxID=528191 RepID=UPI0021B16DF4